MYRLKCVSSNSTKSSRVDLASYSNLIKMIIHSYRVTDFINIRVLQQKKILTILNFWCLRLLFLVFYFSLSLLKIDENVAINAVNTTRGHVNTGFSFVSRCIPKNLSIEWKMTNSTANDTKLQCSNDTVSLKCSKGHTICV